MTDFPSSDAFSFSFFAEPGRSIESYLTPSAAIETSAPSAGSTSASASLPPPEAVYEREEREQRRKRGGRKHRRDALETRDASHSAGRALRDEDWRTSKKSAEDEVPSKSRSRRRDSSGGSRQEEPSRRRSRSPHRARSRSPRREERDLAESYPSPAASIPRPPVQRVRSPSPPFSRTSSRRSLNDRFAPPSSTRHLRPPDVEPGVLTQDILFPSLKGLRWESYAPFLLDQPIELSWSSAYWNRLNDFLESCAPPELWKSYNKPSQPRDLFPIMQQLQSVQPDKAAILREVGKLGTSAAYKTLPEHLHLRIRAARDVMRWLWDDPDISLENAAWLIMESSRDRRLLAIYILIREHASTLRFSDSVEIAQRELHTYLSAVPPTRLSSREHRALILLDWLNTVPSRWYRFFAYPDRTLREGESGEASWEWWLGGGPFPNTEGTLNDWEKRVMRQEEWRD
ncbi:hypothetical protein JCM10213_008420 [Rhodosporidiobolus nylandii]